MTIPMLHIPYNPLLRNITLCVLILFGSGFAQAFGETGTRIVRGNAIEIDGTLMLLYGVSVPTAKSKCLSGQSQWPCGATATLRLNKLLKDPSLQCELVGHSEEVPLTKCRTNLGDIAKQLVTEGWAITVNGNISYMAQEQIAQLNQAGMWREHFEPPLQWREYPETSIDLILDLQCSECAVRRAN